MSDPLSVPSMTLPEALQRANAHWQAGQAVQAEQLCQRIIASFPGQSDALHLLGLIAHAYGRLDQAIDFLRQACATPQTAAVYWSNLAEMLRQKGALREGEQAARNALERNPTLVGAWNNLGIILQEMGRYEESREYLEKVLHAEPNNPRVLNNLGNTCLRLRDFGQAEKYWRKAMELDPNYPQPYSNLAKLLTDRGEIEAAIEVGRKAITLEPHLADAYINLAAAEQERQNTAGALHWIDALLVFQANNAQAWATKATLLKESERLPEALAAAERAVQLAPESADAAYTLGNVQQALGRAEEAFAAYARAGELPGVKAEDALISQAVLHMEQGEKTLAEAFFEKAIERFPASASTWYNWADLHRFTVNDPLLPRMQSLLQSDLLPRDRMLLDFALGKAYLDLEDSENAFRHLHAGNAAKRATFTYDHQQVETLVERIIAHFSTLQPTWPERVATSKCTGPAPVFVVGMPRSGTTLLEQILASHPAVYGAGELTVLRSIIDGAGIYPEAFLDWSSDRLHQLGEQYRERTKGFSPTATFLVDKMPANFFYAGLIPLLVPNARIIHCRRDPVDTCLSCYSKNFSGEQRFSYDLRELGRFYRAYEQLMAFWRQILPEHLFLEVHYEDVVADSEQQVRRLLAFLGLPWESACLNFHETRRAVKTASVNQVRKPIYSSSVGRWKKHAAALQPLLETLQIDPEA